MQAALIQTTLDQPQVLLPALLRLMVLSPPSQVAERTARYAMLVLVGAQGAPRVASVAR